MEVIVVVTRTVVVVVVVSSGATISSSSRMPHATKKIKTTERDRSSNFFIIKILKE